MPMICDVAYPNSKTEISIDEVYPVEIDFFRWHVMPKQMKKWVKEVKKNIDESIEQQVQEQTGDSTFNLAEYRKNKEAQNGINTNKKKSNVKVTVNVDGVPLKKYASLKLIKYLFPGLSIKIPANDNFCQNYCFCALYLVAHFLQTPYK